MIYVLWNGEHYSDRQTLFVEVHADDRAAFYDMVKAAEHKILARAHSFEWWDGGAMTLLEWAADACPNGADEDDPASIERLRPFPPAIVRKRIGWDDAALAAYEKARRAWRRRP